MPWLVCNAQCLSFLATTVFPICLPNCYQYAPLIWVYISWKHHTSTFVDSNTTSSVDVQNLLYTKFSTELHKVTSYFPSILNSEFRIPDSGVHFKNLLFPHQGLLLLLVALLPLVIESAPTIQSLVPALAFTPVVCPIALARSIIKKVPLSFLQHFPFLFAPPHFWYPHPVPHPCLLHRHLQSSVPYDLK